MYLKSFKLTNFRKFGDENNIVNFINGEDLLQFRPEEINIAKSSTLIVGKNNSGKTTVINALERLLGSGSFSSTDFNFMYLRKDILDEYMKEDGDIPFPYLEFSLCIGIKDNKSALLNNIASFLTLGSVEQSEVNIRVKWEIEETEIFIKEMEKLKIKATSFYLDSEDILFDKFLELLDDIKFTFNFYNDADETINASINDLKALVNIVVIKANTITSEEALSKAFNKIIDVRFRDSEKTKKDNLKESTERTILSMNKTLNEYFEKEHAKSINESIDSMITNEKYQVILKSDITLKKLLDTVIKYMYKEGDYHVPETQFGLGYTHLMMIVAEIIQYAEQYHESDINSSINLISIEEPETYMHPQMQELFMKTINELVSSLLSINQKHINSQIIITTHSSHILNSKIHEGDSFNNINYITEAGGLSKVICISDNQINPGVDNDFVFLKKHMKFDLCNLFFADAIIFVEGITEYWLLKYYIDNDDFLKNRYISLMLISGAYGKVYEKLIHLLEIPTVIITDLDIQRSEEEKGIFLQIDEKKIATRITTNDTFKHFLTETATETATAIKDIIKDYYTDRKLRVITQKDSIENYYASSFEEAFILTNSENNILNEVLKSIKPIIYKNIIDNGGLVKNSFKFQMKLKDSKSDFANKLLYEILTEKEKEKENIPVLPSYILDGFEFIKEELSKYGGF